MNGWDIRKLHKRLDELSSKDPSGLTRKEKRELDNINYRLNKHGVGKLNNGYTVDDSRVAAQVHEKVRNMRKEHVDLFMKRKNGATLTEEERDRENYLRQFLSQVNVGNLKPRIHTQYCERTHSGLSGFGKARTHVCNNCNFTAKRHALNCPNCHSKETMIDVGLTARPPKKNAPKKKWDTFWNYWVKNSHPRGCR